MKNYLILGGVILALALITILYSMGVNNKEIGIRMRGEAQQTVCKAFYSNMWEILKSNGAVITEYSEKNKEFVSTLMEGRYSKGDGSLMKWIVESNPTFDASLFKGMMVAIEGQRNGFFIEQSKLIDINREHQTLISKMPARWFISNKTQLGGEKGIIILQNLATQNAYETGTDSSPDLFTK